MTKNIILFGSLLGIFLFTYPLNNANTLATKISTEKLVVNPEKYVPPPVRNAFIDLLEQISDDEGLSLSENTSYSITWTKEKNEYDVVAVFEIGICKEGGFAFVINASFKANGELVGYLVYETACTGLIEF